ncbi:hypothetical protein ACHAO7_010069 [Fusarium culmorum]
MELLVSLKALVVCGDIQPPENNIEGSYTFVKTDVTVWEDLLVLFEEAFKIEGRIDHVFVNAGIGPRTNYLATDVDQDGKLIEPSSATLDVNLKGVINTSTLAIHYLRQLPEGGSIVLTGSATGLQRFRAVDYATAKHGVIGFGRGLVPMLEAAQLPIRVNTLAPSWTDSNVLPSLKELLHSIDIEVQPALAVARCAVYLMANSSKNGHLIHIKHGKYAEVDEAVLLPTFRQQINGDSPSEDDCLKSLGRASLYDSVRL